MGRHHPQVTPIVDDVGTSWPSPGNAPIHTCCRRAILPGRHSAIDWSRPVDLQKFPRWSQMRGFEVILEPGDALYIPSFWLHYIVSLGTNSSATRGAATGGVARGREGLWLAARHRRDARRRRRLGQLHAHRRGARTASVSRTHPCTCPTTPPTRPPRRRSGGPPAPARCLRAPPL